MAAGEVGVVMPDIALLPALPLLAFFIAMPAAGALRRRHRSRLGSEVAADLVAFADRLQREQRCLALDDALSDRLRRLQLRDVASLQLAIDLHRGDAQPIAAAAQRLALRLRRRVAFERKMLARTAPGLRRGAIAATLPPVAVLALSLAGLAVPLATQCLLLAAEVLGCVLLSHWARVEI